MKKLIYCALAFAAGLFASSCQQENLEPVAGGNTVTYTVELPDAATKAADPSRFIGDGKNVDQLIYEVWKTEAEGDDQLNPTNKTYLMFRKDAELNENGVFSFELDLVNNQNYTILFWAQVKNAGHYNTSDLNTADLKNVQIVSDTDAFDESRAAFFGVDFIKASEPRKSRQTKTLTRPFGQINLATTLKTINELGYELTVNETTVTVARVASTFNVAAQKAVDSDQSYVFSVAAPNKNAETYEEKPITVNGTAYKWISMNYVFVPANQGLVDVEYTIATNHGPVYNKISNIPAQVNYKTNIVGNLLTSKTEYIVDLNNSWAGEYVHEVVTVTSAADLQTAINNAPEAATTATNIKIDVEPNEDGEKILDLSEAFAGLLSTKADESVQKTYGIEIPSTKSIILDLNGCTLSQKVNCTDSYSMIRNYGKLVIVDSEGNGKVSFEDLSQGGSSTWGSYVIENHTGAELTVENGTIEHLGSNNWTDDRRPTNLPIQNYAGKVTINGGTLKSPSFRSLRDFTAGGEIVINGGRFEGQVWMQGLGNGTSSLTVNGGDFYPTPDYDGSCIYITNGTNDVQVQINGGMFNTKIGCADAQKAGVNGCIKGGTFTTAAIENTNSALIANGYGVEQNEEGNWVVVPAPVKVDGGYEISNADQLMYFAKAVNAFDPKYINASVKLVDDIDLSGKEWTPIGLSTNLSNGETYRGTFDGDNHVISNMTVTNSSVAALFGYIYAATIKNVTIDAATVNGNHYAAGVVAWVLNNTGNIQVPFVLENCHVKNSVISSTPEQVNGEWDNGDKVGGLIGYACFGDTAYPANAGAKIINCSVENTTVKAYRDFGGLVGYASQVTIENCTTNNVTLEQDLAHDYKAPNTPTTFGLIIGRNEGGNTIDGNEYVADGLVYNKETKTYAISTAEGLVAMSARTIKGAEKVILTADIDLKGVEFNGLSAFNSESPNTFDGQNHVVSNWTYTGWANDMGFIKSWVGTIKNLTVSKAILRTGGRSAVIAANTYTNIENCHVVDCNLQGNWWACGLIAGMHNSGSIKNCSATNSYIKSTGGTGAITGVLNETSGTRTYEGCEVTGCTINNGDADPYAGAAIVGLINIDNATVQFINCAQTNNTFKGTAKDEFVGYNAGDNTTVTIE